MNTGTPTDITGQSLSTSTHTVQESRQKDSIEGLTAATEAPSKDDPALAAKFAALAKREKAIRQQMKSREESFRQREEALKAKESEYLNKYIPKDKLAQSPFEVLQENGVTDEQIAQYLMGRPTGTDAEVLTLKKEIAALRAEQDEVKTQFKTADTERYEQAKKQIKTEVDHLVDKDTTSAFEVIKARGDVAKLAVVDLIEEVYKSEGYLMSPEEAALEVENHLLEQAVQEHQAFSKMQKIKDKINPPAPVEAQEKQPLKQPGMQVTPSQRQEAQQTLSNRMVQTATKPLTWKEKRERAIAAFQGTLTNS